MSSNPAEKQLEKTPPVWLSEHAKEVYSSTIKELTASGRPLLQIHKEALIGFSEACSLLREAGQCVRDEGFSMDGGREGAKRNPAVSSQLSALASVKALASELGLTPASAAKLPKPSQQKANKFKK